MDGVRPIGDGNAVRTRAHAIELAGKTWIKMVITATPPKATGNVINREIDIHDISASGVRDCPEDTWFFMGDSITAFAYDRAALHQPQLRRR